MSRSSEKWCLYTQLEEGEIFSSWLIRAALEVGCSPLTLIDLLWSNWRGMTIDLDQGIEKEKLEILLEHCSESKQRIRESTLKYYSAAISPFKDKGQNYEWILVLGQRNRSNLSGRQVCTECLGELYRPSYLRVKWRFGWHIACV